MTAAGGIGGGFSAGSGDGGSGDGGAGNAGFGGAGGSGGSDGAAGNTHPGGDGQGSVNWSKLSLFTVTVVSAGLGGSPSTGSHQGGGGGGGVLTDGSGIAGDNAIGLNHTGALGGNGYGAGGGTSGYNSGQYGTGGSGADGLVLVEYRLPVYKLTFDTNNDGIWNLLDFVNIAAIWLVDCYETPENSACTLVQ